MLLQTYNFPRTGLWRNLTFEFVDPEATLHYLSDHGWVNTN